MDASILRMEFLTKHVSVINKNKLVDNSEFLEFLIKRRMLHPDLFDKAYELYQVAETVYPGECDLQLYPEDEYVEGQSTKRWFHMLRYQLRLIIHFPELLVTNSHGGSIVTKDMFFAIRMRMSADDANRLIITGFEGNRTTFNYVDYSSGYKFSHLSSNPLTNPPIYTGFCFGDGDIPRVQSQFNQTPDNVTAGAATRQQIFKVLCFNIEPYLKWESLEGGPYKKMSDVFNKSKKYHSGIMSEQTVFSHVDSLVRYKHLIDCDLVLKNGYYVIADNAKFEQSLVEASKLVLSGDNILFKRSINGDLYEKSSIQKPVKVTPIPIPFKQKDYFYTVNKEEVTVEDENSYINPLIKTHVKSKLEFAINSQVATSNFAKRLQDKIRTGQEY